VNDVDDDDDDDDVLATVDGFSAELILYDR
jgi:hypothetical protein